VSIDHLPVFNLLRSNFRFFALQGQNVIPKKLTPNFTLISGEMGYGNQKTVNFMNFWNTIALKGVHLA